MNSRVSYHHTLDHILEERRSNRVFRVVKPEKWSGHKQLIDYLDDLYNTEKSAETK